MEVCKKMCSECPFSRNSSGGWLGPFKEPKELHLTVMSELPFPCHKKMDRDISFSEVGTKRYPLCRGALIYMKHNGKKPRDRALATVMSEISSDETDQTMIFGISQYLKITVELF